MEDGAFLAPIFFYLENILPLQLSVFCYILFYYVHVFVDVYIPCGEAFVRELGSFILRRSHIGIEAIL